MKINKNNKILFVADKIESGGAESQMFEEMKILSNHYIIFLMTYHKASVLMIEDLYKYNIKYINTITNTQDFLLHEIFAYQPNIIHLHNCWEFNLLKLLKLLKKRFPIVMTLHDYRIICPTGWNVKYNSLIECATKSNLLTCTFAGCLFGLHSRNTDANYLWWYKSMWLKHNVDGWSIVNKDLINILTNEKFKNLQLINYPILDKYHFSNIAREKSIVFAGILAEHKGIDRLCKTIKKLMLIDDKIIITIIGDGNMKEQLLYDLKKYKERILLFNNLSLNELYNIFSKSAIVYLPSLWQENFNLIARYSRIVGTPVLLPYKAGFMQRIKKGLSEYYIPSVSDNDAEQLCKLTYKVVDMKNGSKEDRYDELSTCNVNNFINEITKLYNSVIK